MESKTSKVLGIVISCVSFVLILLFIIGLFALPLVGGSVFGEASNFYDLVKALVQAIENISELGEAGVTAGIIMILTFMSLVVFSLVFGIIALVQSIILLVNSIKGLAGKELKAPVKSLVTFSGALFLLVAVMLGTSSLAGLPYFSWQPGLASGGTLILVAAILAFACAVVHHIVVGVEGRKMVNRILDVVVSTLALVGILLMFHAPVQSEEGLRTGVFGVFYTVIGYLPHAAESDSETMIQLIMAMFGAILTIVAMGFVRSVYENGFTLEHKEKKDVDYAKSSIVKSSLWLGFMLVGFVLIVIPFTGDAFGLGVGVSSILAIVFAVLALAGSIVNKVLEGKSAPAKAE